MFIVAPVLNGKPQMSQEQRKILDSEFRKREGKDVRIEVYPHFKGRSNQQNNYLFGVVYVYIMACTGYTKEEVHEAMSKKFLEPKYLQFGDDEIRIDGSTKTLDTVEFITYHEKIRKWAAEFLQCDIPDPEGQPYMIKDSDFKPDVGRDKDGNIVRYSTGEVLATPQELSNK